MTDLQLFLLILGAIFIAAVLFFNWWQEKKFLEASHRQFGDLQRDALMGDFQIDTEAVLERKISLEAVTLEKKLHDIEPDIDANIVTTTRKEETSDLTQLANTNNDVAHVFSRAVVHEEENVSPGITVDWAEGDAPLKTEFNILPGTIDSNHPSTEVLTSNVEPPLPDAFFPQIDLTAIIYLAQPLTGATLLVVLAELPDHNKLVHVYGFNREQHWVLLTSEQSAVEFSCVGCGLQLADRAGPVIKDTLDRFQVAINEASAKLQARVEWQNTLDVLQYANELDAFCIEVDKTVGFHVVQGGNGPFTGTKLRGLAEAGGLRLAADGAFHYENEDGQKLFSVTNQDNYPFTSEMLRTSVIYRITFQLDVARVKNSIEAFNQMVLIARQMVNSLNALLVDDNQRSLSEVQLDKIRQQLKVIQLKMTGHGIAPGSACALRLFS